MNRFYTYVIESEKDGRLYIGSTDNLEDRLIRHNSNRNKYTKGKGRWALIFSKSFQSRSEAMGMEKRLKSWKSPKRIRHWIKEQSG